MKNDFAFEPLTPADAADALYDDFQELWDAASVQLLHNVAVLTSAAVRRGAADLANFRTKYARLAYLVRLAYLSGACYGYCRRECEVQEAVGIQCAEDLSPDDLFLSCLKEDDFAAWDFAPGVGPSPELRRFFAELAELPDSEEEKEH